MKSTFLFREWPYVAVAVLAGGLALRYALMRRRLPPAPFELARAWAQFRGDRLWRASMLLLIAAHLIGICAPRAILAWDGVPWRLYLLESVGLLAGLAAVAAWGRLVWRHMGRGGGSFAAEIADSMLLSLLFVALASGVLTAMVYRWASSWSVATLTPYAISVLYGDPAAALVGNLPFLVQIHLVSSFAVLAVLPFTRLAPFPILALYRLATLARAPGRALAQRAETWLRARDRMAWLWPEREYRWVHSGGDDHGGPRGGEGPRPRRRRADADGLSYQPGQKP
jgi:nitrate reductase gamma subunit